MYSHYNGNTINTYVCLNTNSIHEYHKLYHVCLLLSISATHNNMLDYIRGTNCLIFQCDMTYKFLIFKALLFSLHFMVGI